MRNFFGRHCEYEREQDMTSRVKVSPHHNMDSDVLVLCLLRRRRKRLEKRRLWVHPILRTRNERGEFHSLIQELRLDEDRHKEYFRLCPADFDRLLRMIAPLIERQDTTLRQAIGPAERLAICLRFLATGDSYHTISKSFRVGKSTVVGIVPSVATAIWESLAGEYMPVPQESDWRAIAEGFSSKWAFPHCLGAIDGKHITIKAPADSGSLYYNYKGQFSIVLLAVVDANYLFRVVDIGAFGKSSDGGTLSASALGRALRDGTLNLPDDEPLPNGEHLGKVPFVFVGDEAFPLRKHLLRPYPGRAIPADQRIFNFRLSHARRIVENAFGIMAAQFRVYHRVMELSPCNAEKIVQATTILHNFIRWGHQNSPSTTGSADPSTALNAAGRMGSNTASREALAMCYS
uniref:DDE Tnp4 domain-containing protein n=1 Tax=Cyprinus carpio carpio TaxID=630221 RepID=A0A9J7YEV0_CYPCA